MVERHALREREVEREGHRARQRERERERARARAAVPLISQARGLTPPVQCRDGEALAPRHAE